MDFARPFKVMVKMTESSKEHLYWQNVYVLILTCLVTQAMHFEYTYTQETNHTINALMRFIAQRGHCVAIYCNNGHSFLKADWELKKLYQSLDWSVIQCFTSTLLAWIEFHFNPANAPHWGEFTNGLLVQ
jgi:hypothetical protein